MITAAIVGGFLKKALWNKYALVAGLMLVSFIAGSTWMWKRMVLKESQAVTRELVEHIREKDKVKEHYENRFDDECILSGRVSMHSKGCKKD